MKALYKKEVGYYFKNPIGYIIIVLFAVFANFLFVKDIFAYGTASMRSFFGLLPWLLLIFVPALSMRIFSEELRANTIETLLTLPLSEIQIVLAKFLALLTMVAVGLGLTLSLPIVLVFMSGLYIPEVIMGYIGALALASIFIAISMFFSSITKNQVVAFLSSALVLFILQVFGADFAGTVLPGAVIDVLSTFTPSYYYNTFVKGLIDFRAIFYVASLSVLFIGLTVINLEKRG